jgi:hypothetical protein
MILRKAAVRPLLLHRGVVPSGVRMVVAMCRSTVRLRSPSRPRGPKCFYAFGSKCAVQFVRVTFFAFSIVALFHYSSSRKTKVDSDLSQIAVFPNVSIYSSFSPCPSRFSSESTPTLTLCCSYCFLSSSRIRVCRATVTHLFQQWPSL